MNTLVFTLQQTFLFFVPLLIVALGAMFSERSGVLNIGLEGIMVMGAFFGILTINALAELPAQLQLLCGIIVSMIAGMVYTLFHAFAAITLKADQTISGTALNLFAPAFCIFMARVVQEVQQVAFKNVFRIDKAPVLGEIPFFGEVLFQKFYLTTYLGILILIVSWIVIEKTRFGLRLRACGENPHAADSVGINVTKMRYLGVMISGALGGLGGLVFVVPTSTTFNATVAGYGFLALAVLIFGQWQPGRIAVAALFFGLMKTIAAAYSGIPLLMDLGFPDTVYKIIPYAATIIVLMFTSKNSKSPAASGTPYNKGER